jgi:RNA polymerase sigma factor (sigma-70 family)
MDDDIRSIAEVFVRHGEDMVRWARRTLQSDTDAEDVVQDVLLALLRAPHVLADVDRLSSWLFTIVQRRSVDFIRRELTRRRKEETVGLEDVLEGTDSSERMERQELAEALAVAVDGLPEELRSVFILNGLRDITYREISAATGHPMGTLMARKKRAIEILRAELGDTVPNSGANRARTKGRGRP